MKVIKALHLPEKGLRPLLDQWEKECNCIKFGIETDVASHLSDLSSLIRKDNADLLLLETEDEEIVGYMGLEIFESPLGKQKIANEHYFFIAPQYRGMSAVRMIEAAQKWAKAKSCSHLILNASQMASSSYKRTCTLYERLDFREFETSYILQLTSEVSK